MNAPLLPEPAEPLLPSKRGEPTWNIALFFPRQGQWTEAQYLALDTNRLVELVDGCLEFLPMPTLFHQSIVAFLYDLLKAFIRAHASGEVHFAPLRVRLFPEHIREPDVTYLRPERTRNRHQPTPGADLAMEVVSPGTENRERDYVAKREAYANAGIQEYWIVDPQERRITVLTLDGNAYRVHGEFIPGQQATAAMFPEFKVDVTAAFAAGEGPATA
jgi:Uma2 family endonuclease